MKSITLSFSRHDNSLQLITNQLNLDFICFKMLRESLRDYHNYEQRAVIHVTQKVGNKVSSNYRILDKDVG